MHLFYATDFLFFTDRSPYIRPMTEALLQLQAFVNAVHPISGEDREMFSGIWMPFSAKRKEIITAEGAQERYLYFVIEGVQRVYYFDDQGREATLVFTYGPSFGGVLDALLLQLPSRYFYETLTPSSFLRAPYGELDRLMKARPGIEQLVRIGITYSLSGVLERLVELQCYSAEERFDKVMQRSPHIFKMIPHKYIANYLGMDATNFSKLINKPKF
ncbi:cAMP-binding domain of CRP or a regulatory subunit of cAMP-dependent protein kinases [Chitinophaga sp. YR573]|nr:cAMP-binding domain of CRP or a regulatory subunit of cAMP-dependent protein kinases [Chitinophaga sp. YR573]